MRISSFAKTEINLPEKFKKIMTIIFYIFFVLLFIYIIKSIIIKK